MAAGPVKLTPQEARRIALRAQGLDGGWVLPAGKEGAAAVVDRLGYVQIDTISVIERAHHHVLWTRAPSYRPAMLDELLGERRVFEYWSHAAAYLPIGDYRYYLPKMREYARRPRTRAWWAENRRLLATVRQRIREEGALTSADFRDDSGKRGPWWDWKPAKRALESLFWAGELMIAGRRNFQRLYDLTERVLPADVDTTTPTPAELARFAVRRALQSHGVLAAKRAGWWLKDAKRVRRALREMIRTGEAAPARIDGIENEFVVASGALEAAGSVAQPAVRLLSPFDNLVIERERLSHLFGFDYRLECYTPAPKRKYGYFTLPILWGDRLIGRLDPKVDRRRKAFHVRSLVFEPSFHDYEPLLPELRDALRRFASFHAAQSVEVDRVSPETIRDPMRRLLELP